MKRISNTCQNWSINHSQTPDVLNGEIRVDYTPARSLRWHRSSSDGMRPERCDVSHWAIDLIIRCCISKWSCYAGNDVTKDWGTGERDSLLDRFTNGYDIELCRQNCRIDPRVVERIIWSNCQSSTWDIDLVFVKGLWWNDSRDAGLTKKTYIS